MTCRKTVQLMGGIALFVPFLVGCGAPVKPVVVVITTRPQPTPPAVVVGVTATPRRTYTLNPVIVSTLKRTPLTATVLATDGKMYEVATLAAEYRAGGVWIGGAPTRIRTSLSVVLYIIKDRITTTDHLEYYFASMRRIVFREASIPEDLKAVFGEEKPILIEMRDGSVILLSQTLLIEMNADGQQTRRVDMEYYVFEAGETQGMKITLREFTGRAKTESGQEGDFQISRIEVESIEWK